MSAEHPNAVTIPSSDPAFRRVVAHVLDATDDPAQVERRVRFLYPRARLVQRALSDEPRVYYLYRDGRFEPEAGEEWWNRDDVARVRISLRDGRFVDANDGWHALIGGDASHTLGRTYLDFLLPEAREDARIMFETIAAFGSVHSKALIRRPDGRPLPIEFHAQREDETVVVAYRLLPG